MSSSAVVSMHALNKAGDPDAVPRDLNVPHAGADLNLFAVERIDLSGANEGQEATDDALAQDAADQIVPANYDKLMELAAEASKLKDKARDIPRAQLKPRAKPPLKGLIRFADFTGLKTRKQIKAMAGDMDVEIRRLRKAHRRIAARWNVCMAWGYAMYYVARSPLDKLAAYLLHKIGF